MQGLKTASPREQELIDYINEKLSPLCAVYHYPYGVEVYPTVEDAEKDLEEGSWGYQLLDTGDDDYSMAEAIRGGLNGDRLEDVTEELWERLYAKIEEFTKENAKRTELQVEHGR